MLQVAYIISAYSDWADADTIHVVAAELSAATAALPSYDAASEYYTQEEMAQFTKPKKKRKVGYSCYAAGFSLLYRVGAFRKTICILGPQKWALQTRYCK